MIIAAGRPAERLACTLEGGKGCSDELVVDCK